MAVTLAVLYCPYHAFAPVAAFVLDLFQAGISYASHSPV